MNRPLTEKDKLDRVRMVILQDWAYNSERFLMTLLPEVELYGIDYIEFKHQCHLILEVKNKHLQITVDILI